VWEDLLELVELLVAQPDVEQHLRVIRLDPFHPAL